MLSGDVTYFCEYGRYFLICYYLSEIENLLLLAKRAKDNIQFEIVLTASMRLTILLLCEM